MKKLLLVISTIALTTGAFAQLRMAPGVKLHPTSVPMRAEKVAQKEVMSEIAPLAGTSIPNVAAGVIPTPVVLGSVSETKIGETLYDLQSNRGIGRRVANNGNGTISAVWTFIPAPSGASADRGTGYNYFDGTSWGAWPTSKIEAKRTGFTNIMSLNGMEYVCAHAGDTGLYLSKRSIGSGPWTYVHPVGTFNMFPSQADVWSRMAVGGSNGTTVHVIVNSQGTGTTPVLNQNGPLTYSRSLDGGTTWDIDHVRLPQGDETFFLGFSAENYSIDCRGDIVAIVAGGFDADLAMWKSTDNGANWTKTTLLAFPLPLYDAATSISDINGDSVADTVQTAAEDPTISIDANGICHVAFGNMLILDDVIADLSSYFPTTDGLMYWNENMVAPVMIAAAEDFNGNGFIDLPIPVSPNTQPLALYGNAGMLTHPSIGFDASGAVYLSYAAPNEVADTSIFQCAHRHQYIIASSDGGATWSTPYNVVPMSDVGGDGEFQEAVYGSIAREVDGTQPNQHIHLVYQRDAAPYVSTVFAGAPAATTVGAQQSWNQDANNIPFTNDIIYADVTDIVMGVKENKINVEVNVAPNPASDYVKLSFNMPKSEKIRFNKQRLLQLKQPFFI
jgi:hypothetical protein